MYKLIIADDEEIIRETLAEFVDWESLGFQLVLVAEDGQQVIEFLEQERADVVLTDIQMQGTDGLHVADYIFQRGEGIKTVFLSGYQEFEYAKKAIQYQVKEYLLKPISIATIEACFGRLRQELLQEEADKQARKQMEEEFSKLRFVTFEKLLELTAVGILRERTEISDYIERHGLWEMTDGKYYCQWELKLGPAKEGDYDILVNDVVSNIFDMMAKKYRFYHIFVICGEEEQFRIVGVRDEPLEGGEYQEEGEELIQKICGLPASFCLKIPWMPFWSYQKKLLALYSPEPKLMDVSGDTDREESFFIAFSRQFLLIMNMANDLEEVMDHMTQGLLESIRGLRLSEQEHFVARVVEQMEQLVAKRCEHGPGERLSEFDRKRETLEAYFKRCVKLLYGQLHQRGVQQSVLEEIRHLVMQRITETVTLKEAAEAVFLGPNYFSYVFKDVSGENYSEFCIRLKMEKAAELLGNSRNKVYEISDYLGYKNIKYFYKLFKRVYHCTPTEYREAVQNGSKEVESMEIY